MKKKDGKGSHGYWSVKMRASLLTGDRRKRDQDTRRMHISGAEGLYRADEVVPGVRKYISRALKHPRGMPDEIVLTIKCLRKKPVTIPLLPVRTVRCRTVAEARTLVTALLAFCSVSGKAVSRGCAVVSSPRTMRGAALLRSLSALRAEPDQNRGVRASMLGIEEGTGRAFRRRLARVGINTEAVREAVVLASKVASCEGVVAELCVSDDPDYTTGYVASRIFGYVRVPRIKKKGSRRGGRVFFIEEDADVAGIIKYLEETPVRAEKEAPVYGETTINEIIGKYNR